MDFQEFYNLTEGQRSSLRKSSASRPWDKDWGLAQLTRIADFAVGNPFIRDELGEHVEVQVLQSKDRGQIMLILSRGVSGS